MPGGIGHAPAGLQPVERREQLFLLTDFRTDFRSCGSPLIGSPWSVLNPISAVQSKVAARPAHGPVLAARSAIIFRTEGRLLRATVPPARSAEPRQRAPAMGAAAGCAPRPRRVASASPGAAASGRSQQHELNGRPTADDDRTDVCARRAATCSRSSSGPTHATLRTRVRRTDAQDQRRQRGLIDAGWRPSPTAVADMWIGGGGATSVYVAPWATSDEPPLGGGPTPRGCLSGGRGPRPWRMNEA
jgi:hypothetical protein